MTHAESEKNPCILIATRVAFKEPAWKRLADFPPCLGARGLRDFQIRGARSFGIKSKTCWKTRRVCHRIKTLDAVQRPRNLRASGGFFTVILARRESKTLTGQVDASPDGGVLHLVEIHDFVGRWRLVNELDDGARAFKIFFKTLLELIKLRGERPSTPIGESHASNQRERHENESGAGKANHRQGIPYVMRCVNKSPSNLQKIFMVQFFGRAVPC